MKFSEYSFNDKNAMEITILNIATIEISSPFSLRIFGNRSAKGMSNIDLGFERGSKPVPIEKSLLPSKGVAHIFEHRALPPSFSRVV